MSSGGGDSADTVVADDHVAAVVRKVIGSPQGFEGVALNGAPLDFAGRGCVRCSSFVVPPHLTDGEGHWHTGTVSAALDNLCFLAALAMDGIPCVSVEMDICFLAPAKLNEEVEADGMVVHRKGSLLAVKGEARKNSGEVVAVLRQWMSPAARYRSGESRKSRL